MMIALKTSNLITHKDYYTKVNDDCSFYMFERFARNTLNEMGWIEHQDYELERVEVDDDFDFDYQEDKN